MRREFGDIIIDTIEDTAKPVPMFETAAEIAQRAPRYVRGRRVRCLHNHLQQVRFGADTGRHAATAHPLRVPDERMRDTDERIRSGRCRLRVRARRRKFWPTLLPRNLSVQVFRAMIESFASEQGARMTAMDKRTRNAGDMIDQA